MIETKFEKLLHNQRKYRSLAFWSWDGKLTPSRIKKQIKDMNSAGYGGFIVHARGGLITEYLSDEWMDMVEVAADEAKKYGMRVFIYDELGWPSGFVGGKLLENEDFLAQYFEYGKSDSFPKADFVFAVKGENYEKTENGNNVCDEYIFVDIKKSISNTDILKSEVTDAFIEQTHEKYYERLKNRFGSDIEGFFTDEPQYFRYATPYSEVIRETIKEKYGYDIFDRLPELFFETGDYKKTRYDYYLTLHERYIDNFVKKIYYWCEAHNCKLTGHTIEESRLFTQMWCCGGAMPFYEYEHIPCVDSLCKAVDTENTAKQVGSVASQLGKNEVLTESFACSGWNASLNELKRVAENQYVGGVNMLTEHLYHYSFSGQRKFDHPTSFSPENPWFKDFGFFNEYFGKLGSLIAGSKEIAEALVIHPMRSAYLTYERISDDKSVKELDEGLLSLTRELSESGVTHNFGDESLIEKYGAITSDGKFRVGKACYETVFLPTFYSLSPSTVALLKEYVKKGGKLVLAGKTGEYINGEKADLSFLKTNFSIKKAVAAQKIRYAKKCKDVRLSLRSVDDEVFCYITNPADGERTVEFFSDYGKPYFYSLYDGKYYEIEEANGKYRVSVKGRDSAIIVFGKKNAKPLYEVKSRGNLRIKRNYADDNYLTIDAAKVSFDGENYGNDRPVPEITESLIKEKYKGRIFLKYSFETETAPKKIKMIFEKSGFLSAKVNGKKIAAKKGSEISDEFYSADVAKLIKEGKNDIVFEIYFEQSPDACHILYDEGVTESLKNCFRYLTELNAIYLRGDFGVKCRSIMAENGLFVAENGFVLTKSRPGRTANGEPFFAGRVRYSADISPLENGFYEFKAEGNFTSFDYYLNGKKVKKSSFDGTVRLKIKKGDSLEIEIVSGNRNLLGPHHAVELEPFGVSPYEFTMSGSWKDGKSDKYRQSYSFVPFGLKKIKYEVLKTEKKVNKEKI